MPVLVSRLGSERGAAQWTMDPADAMAWVVLVDPP